ncbi:hypothetical protein T05_11861 [Trichinella murrelli]|uniref:Uncharacterized protein n=1 Tax=Trichinella murrelli TaxID=144512 RepID=A0A0V0SPW2_9BILA|nr:hypothetical protein T05_11861 [Trichinella murrelli]
MQASFLSVRLIDRSAIEVNCIAEIEVFSML